jgi:octaprenyl-diphosphate synthase
MSSPWDLFEKTLINRLSSESPFLRDMIAYLVGAGGKRLRPQLVFLVARLLGEVSPRHILFAQALESIHSASLFHDDVIDQGETRRDQACAQHVWGNTRTILAGDFLLTRGFSLLIELADLELLRLMQRATQDLLEGQVQEYDLSQHSLVPEYIKMIEKKTASLFAAACQGAALLSGASLGHQQALYTYGLCLGTGYQLLDDSAEYDLSPTCWHKGHDFIEQKITYPLLLAHHASDYSLSDLFSMDCFDRVKTILAPFLEETRHQASLFYQRADRILQDHWPDHPHFLQGLFDLMAQSSHTSTAA